MVTELRQDCLRRQKSAHLIEEKECSSWPTPNNREPVDNVKIDHYLETVEMRFSPTGYKAPRRLMLEETVIAEEVQKNWLTPTANENEQDVEKFIKRMEKYPNGTTMPSLSNQVKSRTTPTSRDHKDGDEQSCKNVPSNGLLGREVHNTTGKNRGSLNPDWVEQLMGLPRAWTDLGSWATESFHSKRQEHIKC
jgi:hypothetical protein